MLIRSVISVGKRQDVLLPGYQRVLMLQLKDSKGKKKIILSPVVVPKDKVTFGLVKNPEMIKEILSILDNKETNFFGRYIEEGTKFIYYVERISLTDDELSLLWPILTSVVPDEPVFFGNVRSYKIFPLKKQDDHFVVGKEQYLDDIEVSDLTRLILSDASFL